MQAFQQHVLGHCTLLVTAALNSWPEVAQMSDHEP